MNRITFTTGRLYTQPHGQLITAVFRDDKLEPRIEFNDQSRGISGVIRVHKEPQDHWEFAKIVMTMYDGGQYSWLSMSDSPKHEEGEKIYQRI